MAILKFKAKDAVWNHSYSVPYHTLEKSKKHSLKGIDEEENLIIEGDNLVALKSLLPQYQGKIACIYIDPPYNTGNEGWVYNDDVNSPVIKQWIGEVVGKEGEDLVRHDKWLCMMTPRLKLLRELLSENGMIFISIHDTEYHHLRTLMDEIFGENNFVATMIRQGIKGGTGPSNEIRRTHDYVLAFAKSKEDSELLGLELDALELDKKDDGGPYRIGRELNKWGAGSRREDSPTMWFPVTGPKGEEVYPIRNDGSEGRWRWGKTKMLKAVKDKEVIFEPRGDGTYIVYEKIRENTGRRRAFSTLELTNAEGTEALKGLFDDKSPFDYPKPPSLISFLVGLCANEDGAIVLDSFAGSGTTAQGVFELSAEDGVNRKCILIQLPEEIKKDSTAHRMGFKWVHEVTRERVKRFIGKQKSKIGFSYLTLGASIDSRKILEGKELPSWDNFAKYAHYLATGKSIEESNLDEKTWEIKSGNKKTGVFLIYKNDLAELKNLAITRDWLEKVKGDERRKIVYAPACFLDKEVLDEHNVQFVQIPFNLFSRA